MTKAIIIGRAAGVWEEVAQLQAMVKFDATIVIGKAGVDYPGGIDYWVTFHPNLFPNWVERRRAQHYPDAHSYWASTYRGRLIRHKNMPEYPGLRRVECNGGSSGMIGMVVALDEVKADRIALAGIPMQGDRRHYDEDKIWEDAQNFRAAWVEAAPRMMGRVRSMSGWTRELLGGEAPTQEWFTEEQCGR